MKPYLSILMLSGLLFSCTQEEMTDLVPNTTPEQTTSKIRSVEDAIEIANHLASFDNNKSRTVSKDVKNVKVIKSAFSRSQGNDTLIYAINYEDNAGFALISASYNAEPVLALTEQGEYGSEKTMSNPGFAEFVGLATEYVQNAETQGIPLPKDTLPQLQLAGTKRLDVSWGENWPEGALAPNGKAGCAAVATAQILSYFETPVAMPLTYPGHENNILAIHLDWSALKKHKESENILITDSVHIIMHDAMCPADQAKHNVISRLCRELGHRAGTNYSSLYSYVNGSAGTLNTLRSFIADREIEVDDNHSLYDYLSEDGVALIKGSTAQFSMNNHIWVADGYSKMGPDSIGQYNPITGEFIVIPNPSSKKYLHFNWGWGGDCNGYFAENVYNTQSGVGYEGSYDTSHNYQYNIDFWVFQ